MSDNTIVFGEADLTSCDREQIHIPSSIQPNGVLLVLDPDTLVVQQAAGATLPLLGISASDILGMALPALLPQDKVSELKRILLAYEARRPIHLFGLQVGAKGTSLDLSIHRNEAGLILEFEPATQTGYPDLDALSQVQTLIAAVSEEHGVERYCQSATEHLQRLTGYDRVMVYRFLPDKSGEVVAETATSGSVPFLGLRYPASDIPMQARALYLTNWLRVLSDVDAVPAPLQPGLNPTTLAPLDMSHAMLRSVSPVHLEYLRNMGVTATMTVSIIANGELWGLIACHHHSSKQLPRHLRAVCDLFGNMFALQLDARERAEALEYRHRAKSVHADIVSRMSAQDSLATGLIDKNPTLLDYLDADGVAVMIDGGYQALGRTPGEAQVRALVQWLDANFVDGSFASNNLSGEYGPGMDFATEASGVLAISATRNPSDCIIWFRPELVENVRWAGDPTKPVEVGPLGDRLTPRKSFDEWMQSVRYQARPWTQNEIDAASQMRVSLLEVVLNRIDEVARERAVAQERHEVMVAELNHRVKNTLATIQSLARYTHQSADSLSAYVTDFERRIQAMATSHSLLSESSWQQTDLRTLVAAQLEPYQGGANVMLDGPDVAIRVIATGPMSMVVHELATNAAKYGALSTGGQVRISWDIQDIDGGKWLSIGWRESGGPRVIKPTREGFGTFTVKQIIPFQCGGRSDLRYPAFGVECDIELDAECFVDERESMPTPDPRPSAKAVRVPVGGKARILVVEDETIIAFMIQRIVLETGQEVVGPVSRLAMGLDIAASQPLSGALLDVNLAGELTWPIARVLRERGIPFVFMSGYAQTGFMIEEFADVQVVAKPFRAEEVKAAIASMVDGVRNA